MLGPAVGFDLPLGFGVDRRALPSRRLSDGVWQFRLRRVLGGTRQLVGVPATRPIPPASPVQALRGNRLRAALDSRLGEFHRHDVFSPATADAIVDLENRLAREPRHGCRRRRTLRHRPHPPRAYGPLHPLGQRRRIRLLRRRPVLGLQPRSSGHHDPASRGLPIERTRRNLFFSTRLHSRSAEKGGHAIRREIRSELCYHTEERVPFPARMAPEAAFRFPVKRLHTLHERTLRRRGGFGERFADRRHGRRLYILAQGDQAKSPIFDSTSS